MQNLWFKAKNYGWGWVPVSWQGWVVTLLYVLGIVYILLERDRDAILGNHAWENLIINFIFLTLVFVLIAYKTGEKPRWRWGEDK